MRIGGNTSPLRLDERAFLASAVFSKVSRKRGLAFALVVFGVCLVVSVVLAFVLMSPAAVGRMPGQHVTGPR